MGTNINLVLTLIMKTGVARYVQMDIPTQH